jgi:probable DNA metabolism protein
MLNQAPTIAGELPSNKSNSPSFEQLGPTTTSILDQLKRLLATGPVVIGCDPTLEGVLAAVGLSYLAHAKTDSLRLAPKKSLQPQLNEGCLVLSTDDEMIGLARRVWKGFKNRFEDNKSFAYRILLACSSDDPLMPETVFCYMHLGFSVGKDLETMMSDPSVSRLNDMARFVSNECEHTRQFVRFSHMSDGSWWASFCPKADTLPLVCSHFAARMGNERFCLLDPIHLRAVLFDKKRSTKCSLIRLDSDMADQMLKHDDVSDEELQIRAMWRKFYQSMELEDRGIAGRGYDLRAHWMPKRFWANLTELNDQSGQIRDEKRFNAKRKPRQDGVS